MTTATLSAPAVTAPDPGVFLAGFRLAAGLLTRPDLPVPGDITVYTRTPDHPGHLAVSLPDAESAEQTEALFAPWVAALGLERDPVRESSTTSYRRTERRAVGTYEGMWVWVYATTRVRLSEARP